MASSKPIESAPPPEFERLNRLYDALHDEAQRTDGGLRVFEGSKTKLYDETGLSMKYYGDYFRMLEQMECIKETRSGNSVYPTRIELYKAPALDNYLEMLPRFTDLTKRESLGTLRKKVATLEERMPPIDLNRFLMSLDEQLSKLDERLTKLESAREESLGT